MGRFVRPRLLLSLAAVGMAAVLGGCVAYPAYPGYAPYPAYGYGYAYPAPYYGGAYVGWGGGGGWRR